MEEKKVSTLFEEMRDDIGKYINSTLELGKLEAFEKFSLGSSAFLYGLIIAGAGLLASLFILVTAGLYLSELLDSLWLGFGIVAAFTLLVLIILLYIALSRSVGMPLVSIFMTIFWPCTHKI